MDFGAATHPGYIRSGNEDGFFASREHSVFAVADGMGGHDHGEVASQLVLEVIATQAAVLAASPAAELANALYDTVQTANAVILAQAERHATRNRMGTTLVLATICNDRLYFAHIGDSRLYLLRGDVFTQLTRDHSLVQAMVDSGEISANEAAIHPLRHQITRVVGGDNRVSPEIASQALEAGDVILLCSDGLSGAVGGESIKEILRTESPAQERAQLLVQAALDAGGPDNITALVVRYQCPRQQTVDDPVRSRHAMHAPSLWVSLLWMSLGILLLLSAGVTWHYTHPHHVVAVDASGTFGLYQTWPLLPMLHRKKIETPTELPSITQKEALPFLTQSIFQPGNGDMRSGITVKNKEAGEALLAQIVNVTAAGYLTNAREAMYHADLEGAEQLLDRAQALHADSHDLQKLSLKLKLLMRHRANPMFLPTPAQEIPHR